MIVDRAEIDAILSRRVRRRVLMLPVRRGPFGELKRCPMRKGGVYILTPRIPYDEHRERAAHQPTQARAVLELIDRCLEPGRRAAVTVLEVERQEDVWLVRFIRGEHAEMIDRPIYLSKYGDYTMSASRQAVPGDPAVLMPLEKDLEAARAKALDRRVSPQAESLRKAAGHAESLQESLQNMKARQLVKRAQRNYEAAARLLLSENDVHSRVSASAVGSPGKADRPPASASSASPELAA